MFAEDEPVIAGCRPGDGEIDAESGIRDGRFLLCPVDRIDELDALDRVGAEDGLDEPFVARRDTERSLVAATAALSSDWPSVSSSGVAISVW